MKLMNLIVVFSLLAVGCRAVVLEVPGYATVEGDTQETLLSNRTVYRFRGLFYGQKPTSETRFLPPVPFTPDPDVLFDATNYRGGCNQKFGGNEDCLLVNIYTPYLPGNASDPETNFDTLLPVLFWLHGGSFSTGGGLFYDGSKYLEQDVVLVTVQYRLSALGWLSLNTDEIPGNAGAFDQLEALKWTNRFIKYFGGDPNLVTLVGESAGGASVSLLTLAPQARGLFHRVISQSGAMTVAWALDRDPVTHGRRIAEIAGCELDPYPVLLDCLRNVDADNLTEAFEVFVKEDRKNGGLGFGGSSPVIQVAGAQRILETDPLELYESGNYATEVPMMYGCNKQEGSLVLGYLYNDHLEANDLVNDTEFLTNDLVPLIIRALGGNDPTGELARNYTEKYLGYAELGNFDSMAPGLTDLTGVLFEKEGAYDTIRRHSKFNPKAYWYAFNFEGRRSLFNVLFAGHVPPIDPGVCHADEMMYLFDFPLYGMNETETILSSKMVQIWTNFAKYGDPTPDGVELLPGIPKFPAYTDENLSYMDIDADWAVKRDYTLTYTVTVDEMLRPKSAGGNKP